jgi:hypothetical protein
MIDLVPSEFQLSQNYPNPFSERTTIKLCVAYKTRVTVEVFTSEGTMVDTLLDEEKEAGTYELEFSARKLADRSARDGNASNIPGSEVSPPEAVYVYRLQAGDFSATKKMLLKRV